MMSAESLQQQQERMRRKGPGRLPSNFTTPTMRPEPVCICKGIFIMDGEEYFSTDPGCPEHGFEAQTKARAQYIAEPSREEEPLNMKGRDSR